MGLSGKRARKVQLKISIYNELLKTKCGPAVSTEPLGSILQRRLKHVLDITGQTGQGGRPQDACFIVQAHRGEGAPLNERYLTAKGVAANTVTSGARETHGNWRKYKRIKLLTWMSIRKLYRAQIIRECQLPGKGQMTEKAPPPHLGICTETEAELQQTLAQLRCVRTKPKQQVYPRGEATGHREVLSETHAGRRGLKFRVEQKH